MTTRRTIPAKPPVAIDYDSVFSDDGETVVSIVPVRFWDLAQVPPVGYTAINPDKQYPDTICDPDRVAVEFSAILQRDALSAAAIQASAPHIDQEQIERFDDGSAVILTTTASNDAVAQAAIAIAADPNAVGEVYLNGVFVGAQPE